MIRCGFDEEARAFDLELAVLAHPEDDGEQPRADLRFHGVAGISALLQRGETVPSPTPAQPWRLERRPAGGPTTIADLAELGAWLDRFRGDIYGQAAPMFDRPPPAWIDTSSLTVSWAPAAPHAVDLDFDTTPATADHHLSLRLSFTDVTAHRPDGRPWPLPELVADVRTWWRGFKAGHTHGQHGIVRAAE